MNHGGSIAKISKGIQKLRIREKTSRMFDICVLAKGKSFLQLAKEGRLHELEKPLLPRWMIAIMYKFLFPQDFPPSDVNILRLPYIGRQKLFRKGLQH